MSLAFIVYLLCMLTVYHLPSVLLSSLKSEVLSVLCKDYFTIIRDHVGWSLTETQNKRICQTSGLKTGRGPLTNMKWSLTRELV